ncbi:MAG: AI-2E family transporter [Coriobacteriales bacterium]|jgi:predicted PurR-regulated permease PerM|nr:AI-2E family transporter [Coriobacteriales bacterium]
MRQGAGHNEGGRLRRWGVRAWAIIGIALIALAVLFAIGQVWTSVSIILFSAFLVFILRVPVAWLARHRVPRGLAAFLCYVVALAALALILFFLVPTVVQQIAGLASLVPGWVGQAQSVLSNLINRFHLDINDATVRQALSGISSSVTAWASGAVSGSANFLIGTATGVAGMAFVVAISVIVGFWVLKDLPKIQAEVRSLFPQKYQGDVRYVAEACSQALGGYVRSMVISCLFEGILTGIIYTLIGLPYPAVFAMFTGLMVFIPFVGPIIAWLLAGVIGLFVSPLTAVLAVVLTLAVQITNDYIISPRILSANVSLHPAISLVVITLGMVLGGVFGMLCAVPLTAAAKTIFIHYYELSSGRKIAGPDGAFFQQDQDNINNKTVALHTVLFRRNKSSHHQRQH